MTRMSMDRRQVGGLRELGDWGDWGTGGGRRGLSPGSSSSGGRCVSLEPWRRSQCRLCQRDGAIFGRRRAGGNRMPETNRSPQNCITDCHKPYRKSVSKITRRRKSLGRNGNGGRLGRGGDW